MLALLTPPLFASTFARNTHYSLCFTPGRNCTCVLVNKLNHAHQSIDAQVYTFTSYKIARALIRAQRRGVQVKVLTDKSNFDSDYHSSIASLLKAHIPVWCDNKVTIAHNKVMVIDNHIVETGSFNYTYAANHYNAENMLIIDNKKLAKQYLVNWQRRLKRSYRVQHIPSDE